jgi:hypothetical protein
MVTLDPSYEARKGVFLPPETGGFMLMIASECWTNHMGYVPKDGTLNAGGVHNTGSVDGGSINTLVTCRLGLLAKTRSWAFQWTSRVRGHARDMLV